MAGDLINIVFFMAVFSFAGLFSLFSFTFNPSQANEDQKWRGPVYSAFAFVFWLVLAQIHAYVCANFGATELMVVANLWYIMAVFFVIFTVYLIFQTLNVEREKKKWSI